MKKEITQRYPENKQVEFSVISMLLKNRINIDKAYLFELNVDSFYHVSNRQIFLAIDKLYKSSSVVDLNTVSHELNSMQSKITYDELVHLLSVKVDNDDNLEGYVTILKDLEDERLLLTNAKEIESLAYNGDMSKDEKFSLATSLFKTNRKEDKIYYAKSDFKSFTSKLRFNMDNPGAGILPLPWEVLNEKIGGGMSVGVNFLAAQPATGKSIWAEMVIYHTIANKYKIINSEKVLVEKGKNVLFFSKEMTFEQLFYRKVQRDLGIQAKAQMAGNLTEQQFKDICNLESELTDNLAIDTKTRDVRKLVIKAKLENKKKKLDLIVIDYIQILNCSGKFAKRLDEINEIMSEITELAKTLEIPILVLSQLNKNEKENENSRPQLDNLKESSNLGQDCVSAIILHRPYRHSPGHINKDLVEVIVAKDRYDKEFVHEIKFVGQRLTLREFTHSDIDERNAFLAAEQEEKQSKKKTAFKS